MEESKANVKKAIDKQAINLTPDYNFSKYALKN